MTDRRDFIVFDQRGVGLSQPSLECPELVPALYDVLMEPDLQVYAESQFEALMACRDRLVAGGHNLAAYTTAQNAADVEAIRLALGYDRINVWGGSYGSHLAQAVMRDHPQGIRSAILESVYPLETSFAIETARTVPAAMMDFLAACEEDEACDQAFPDLTDVFFQVIDELNAEPVTITLTNPLDGTQYEALLTGDDVLTNLKIVLYDTLTMPTVPQAIYDVAEGDYGLMTQLSSLHLAYATLTTKGMQLSVMCTDDLIGRSPDELLELVEIMPSQLVGEYDHDMAIQYGLFGLCEAWPVVEADASAKEPLVSDIPTLILSGEFDPVTPPEFGRQVAARLPNSYFFEFPGAGHSGDSTNPCALAISASFLDDPTTAPDDACLADMEGLVFAVPTDAGEIALEPYVNEEMGIEALAPTGWSEVQPGIFTRGNPAVDMAVVQLAVSTASAEEVLGILSQNYGLTQVPEPIAERDANGLAWALYAIEAQGVPRDIALAEDSEGVLIVIMRSGAREQEELRAGVFVPILDSMVRLAQ
jgi:pimeloyl-ACP methyl ester carboxylesterase